MEETKQEGIKAVVPAVCPHCNKDIIVQFEIDAPKMSGVFTLDQVGADIKKLIEEQSTA